MFIPFAFNIDPLFYNPITPQTQSLYAVGLFYTYQNPYLGNIAVLDTTGSLNSSYNSGRSMLNLYQGFWDGAYTCNIQPDGKILVGGPFTAYSGSTTVTRGARTFISNGNRDTSFNIGTAGFNSNVFKILRQSNGNILAGGQFTSYSGSAWGSFIRTNNSGTLDATFSNPQVGSTVYTFATQSDGKILVGGTFTSVSGSSTQRIVRLNTNGTKDNTFNIGTGFNSSVHSILVQSDGKILVGGSFTTYSGSTATYLARLNVSGSLDTTFTSGQSGVGSFNSAPTALGLQSDGKVIAYGNFTTYSGSSVNRIVRLNTNGNIDNTFNVGTGFNSYSFTTTGTDNDELIFIDSNNKIYVGGSFSSYSGSLINGLIRLNSDGTIDTAFNTSGSYGVNGFNSGSVVTSVRSSGSSVIATGNYIYTWKYPATPGLVNLSTSGSLIATPFLTSGFKSTLSWLGAPWVSLRIKQTDGKTILAGYFVSYNGLTRNALIRLNSDNSLDSTYNVGTGFNSVIENMKLLPSGETIAVGSFTVYNGSTRNRIVQLTNSGSINTSFDVGTGFNSSVYSMILQPDGKIVCFGAFTTYSGSSANRIVRLTPDGKIDPTFNIGTGPGTSPNIYTSALQSDGKIIIGGSSLNSYNGTTVYRIARISSSGSLDPTFNVGTGFNFSVTYAGVLSDGGIICCGEYTTYSGSSVNRIIKLLPSGARDTTFNIGTGLDYWSNESYVQATVQDASGNIYLGGTFGTYSGSIVNGITKISSNGKIDTSFNPVGSAATGFNFSVKSIYLDT
jgi:uncharacterized delta-60 repeat protein